MRHLTTWRRLTQMTALCSIMSATSALAQDQASERSADPSTKAAGEIVVTGSRLRDIEATGSPVIGLGRADLEGSSVSTVA